MSYEDELIRESVGDGTVDPDDVCMVCDKRNCVCPPEEEIYGHKGDVVHKSLVERGVYQPFIPMDTMRNEDVQPDVIIQNEGNIFILWAVTDKGTTWLEANVASAQRWGVSGFVVEHRYVNDVIAGMIESGLKVASGAHGVANERNA